MTVQKTKIIILFVLIFGAAFLMQFPLTAALEKELKTDYTDINGQHVSFNKEKTLMIFVNFNNSQHKTTLFYSQALYDKFKSSGLNIIAIIKDNISLRELRNCIKRFNVYFPIIFDKNEKLHHQFNLKGCCGGCILSVRGVIKQRFDTLLIPENLRQLLEKEILGKIDYDSHAVQQKIFFKGKIAPNLKFYDPGTHEWIFLHQLKDINSPYRVLTFFSSLCSMCKTGKRFETLNLLDQQLNKDKKYINIIPVFLTPLDSGDIDEWREQFKIPFQIFLSPYLFSLEERYLTESSFKKDPFTIVLDPFNKIIFIEEDGINDIVLADEIKEIIREGK